VVLWPHGVLFRDSEAEMRKKMIESDVVDCVIGLGPNLFYNSPMESCLLICRTAKPKERRNKILFINAVKEVKTEKSLSSLEENNIQKIFKAYTTFKDYAGLSAVVSKEDVLSKNASLNISAYVSLNTETKSVQPSLNELIEEWQKQSGILRPQLNKLIKELRS
jgi:type I restriction enzyme M protein